MNSSLRSFSATLAILLATLGLAHQARGQNPGFDFGDLVIGFQSGGAGNERFVLVSLGDATTYRDARTNRIGITNVNTALREQFGSNWAERNDVFMGAIGIWGIDSFDETGLNNGDPNFTLYVSTARERTGTAGASASLPPLLNQLSLTVASDASYQIMQDFDLRGTAALATLTNAGSFVDWMDKNPVSGTVQQTGLGAFTAGIHAPFGPGAFGTLGGVTAEAAIDLYRLQFYDSIPGQFGFGEPIGVGRYAGTVVINAAGSISFIAAANVEPPVISTTSLPTGAVGSSYSETLGGTGSAPLTWSRDSGDLPPGLSLAAGGLLSGTPTTVGNFTFTVRLTDGNLLSATREFTVRVTAAATAPTITTSTLDTGRVGTAYREVLSATGGSTPYTWSVSVGELPHGLALGSGNGTISGTPTAGGTFAFTVRVRGSDNLASTRNFTITVAEPPTITTSSLPGATVATPYSATLAASGGSTPYTWSVSDGGLPNGMTLATSGTITGTPSARGVFNFTVRVTGSDNLASTRALSITVAGPPAITTASLPGGIVGTVYSQIVTATGGETPYSWSVDSGSLPDGLILNTASGAISGTPSKAGTFNFVLRVTGADSLSATRALTIRVGEAPTITTTSLPSATTTSSYSQTLRATGGEEPYSWGLASGALPQGLSLSTSGTISGTPAMSGVFSFTVRVTGDNGLSSTRAFTLTVASPPTITTTSLPRGATGSDYSATLTATGGDTPYSWSISLGSLPSGLTLSSSGVISGIPSLAGNFTFTVQVTGADSLLSTRIFTLVVAAAPSITTSALVVGAVGEAYSQTLQATGGEPPLEWSLDSGTLPQGLTLSSSGVLSGMPTRAETADITIRVTSADSLSSTQAYRLVISDQPTAPTIITGTLPGGRKNTSYSALIEAAGGLTPYTFAIASGSLPTGVVFATDGSFSGTPTAAGEFPLTIRVTGSNNRSSTSAFVLRIGDVPTIVNTAFPGATVGTPYFQEAQSSGGLEPVTWSIIAGALPPGLVVDSSGVITGTPTTAGVSNFTLQVTAADGLFARRAFSIITSAAPSIQTTSLPGAIRGTTYSQILQASGGVTPYTWSLTSGSLPAGITLSGGGALTGTPTAAGVFSFMVRVAGADGLSATQALTLSVSSAPSISTSSLVDGTVGVLLSQTLTASGGSSPYTWSVQQGLVPPGLILSTGGVLAGSPTTAGVFTFVVQVAGNDGLFSRRTFSMSIVPPITIATATLPGAVVGQRYTSMLEATGGRPPYSWSLASGPLPAGLTLSANGSLSGTPSAAGSTSFAVRVTGSDGRTTTRVLGLAILVAPTISTPSLSAGAAGSPYSATLSAVGGRPPYTWSVISGSLPRGLLLSPTTGTISGTPTATGTFSFTVGVAGADGALGRKSFSLSILPTPVITTSSLPLAVRGAAYSAQLEASAARTPYTWRLARGPLPAGLTLSTSGRISGIPGATGTANITVSVTSADGVVSEKALTLRVSEQPVIVTNRLADGVVRVSYSARLEVAGGTPGYQWRVVSGALPVGLNLSATGTLSGTPVAAGNSTFTVRVTGADDLSSQKAFTLSVVPKDVTAPIVTLDPNPPQDARVTERAVRFSGSVVEGGGIPVIQYRLYTTSSLASAWKTVATQTSSSPFTFSVNATLTAGPNTFEVRAVDKAGNVSPTASRSVSYVVPADLRVIVPAATEGTVTPGFGGVTSREVGRSYTVQALPASGRTFREWKRNGTSFSSNASLTFVMSQGLVLEPVFQPSAGLVASGRYVGLVGNGTITAGTATGQSAFLATQGSIDFQVSPSGAFTGTLRLQGRSDAFNGTFDSRLQSRVMVTRGTLSAATITLTYSLAPSPVVRGSISGIGSPLGFTAGRSGVSSSSTHPLMGLRFQLDAPAPAGIPVNPARLYAMISSTGDVALTGQLGDGTPVGGTIPLVPSGTNTWILPLHLTPYPGNRGILWGTMRVSQNGSTGVTISGETAWLRPGSLPDGRFPQGLLTPLWFSSQRLP